METYAIQKRAEKAISEKVFPGCVVGYVTKQGKREIFSFGTLTYESDAREVTPDTMYDVASITKSIPTGSLALVLIDQGKLRLTDKLIDYLPEFQNSDRDLVEIKHLLTYTLDGYGLASALDGFDGKSLHKRNADDLRKVLLTHNFEKRPGAVFKYTNIPAALLGLVIERVSGCTLDQFAQEYFFEPLHMRQTTFFPERFPKDSIAPTEIDDWRGVVQGMVHDESAYICKREGKIVGHAGLFSNAPDILHFLEVILQDGEFHGKRFFSPGMVAAMQTNQIPELGEVTGLGWEMYQPRYMGKYAGEHTIGKTGFTGTLCVADRKKGIAYVILSNRTYPTRPKDSAEINAFRADVGNILLG